MNNLSGMFTGALISLSASVSACCGRFDEKPHPRGLEKSFIIIEDQPSLAPPPDMRELRRQHRAKASSAWERAPRKRRGPCWSNFSVRKGFLSYSSPRRPQISAPTNFIHVSSGASRFPDYGQPRYRPRSFRPLELSIYMASNRLSPMLPHFEDEFPSPSVTPPQRALITPDRCGDSDSVSHKRSWSSVSFHIPRKPLNNGSVFDSSSSISDVIQRPSPARVREFVPSEADDQSHGMDDLLESIASAMLERDKIQSQIDDVVERQSIYVGSRASSATGRRPSTSRSLGSVSRQPSISTWRMHSSHLADMEPMPDIPALPPNAPSFSERLSFDRPQTAPSKKPLPTAHRARSSSDTAAVSTPSPTSPQPSSPAPLPPLPLRLRPPLRKKKSFSRVSNWLGYPGDQPPNGSDASLGSPTTNPRPVKATDGFYQVASPSGADESMRTGSIPSDDIVSDWSASEDEEDQTVPSSWSPSSVVTVKAMDPTQPSVFGVGSHRNSVGVAF